MIYVKVLTGKSKERKITLARAKESKRLIADGWRMLHVDPALHPSEIVDIVESLILLSIDNGYDKVFFISNCDHVFNKIRVLRCSGKVDRAEFIQYNLDDSGSVCSDTVSVLDTGECDHYPRGLLEEWNNQLLQLLCHHIDSSSSGSDT